MLACSLSSTGVWSTASRRVHTCSRDQLWQTSRGRQVRPQVSHTHTYTHTRVGTQVLNVRVHVRVSTCPCTLCLNATQSYRSGMCMHLCAHVYCMCVCESESQCVCVCVCVPVNTGAPLSTVNACSWSLKITPVSGWGATSAASQKATAGWLSALQVFEPHWQVRSRGLYACVWVWIALSRLVQCRYYPTVSACAYRPALPLMPCG